MAEKIVGKKKKEESVFTKKYGPLPGWAWAVSAGLLIAGVLYLLKRGGPEKTTEEIPIVPTPSRPANVEDLPYGGTPETATPPSQMLDYSIYEDLLSRIESQQSSISDIYDRIQARIESQQASISDIYGRIRDEERELSEISSRVSGIPDYGDILEKLPEEIAAAISAVKPPTVVVNVKGQKQTKSTTKQTKSTTKKSTTKKTKKLTTKKSTTKKSTKTKKTKLPGPKVSPRKKTPINPYVIVK